MADSTIPAENFVQTLAVNVDNAGLSDADFRQMVRNTMPTVVFNRTERIKELTGEHTWVHIRDEDVGSDIYAFGDLKVIKEILEEYEDEECSHSGPQIAEVLTSQPDIEETGALQPITSATKAKAYDEFANGTCELYWFEADPD